MYHDQTKRLLGLVHAVRGLAELGIAPLDPGALGDRGDGVLDRALSRSAPMAKLFAGVEYGCLIRGAVGVRLLSKRAARACHPRISPGALQTLPAYLSGDWKTSTHLHDYRRQARYADAVIAQNAWRIAYRLPGVNAKTGEAGQGEKRVFDPLSVLPQ